MTGRERFLTAMRNGIPDRVPVTPDISNYIPAGRTGLPFWEIYFDARVPLWRAYIEAAEHFRLDSWIGSCASVPVVTDGSIPVEHSIMPAVDRDAMLRRTTWRTPDGDLTQEDICFRHEPPTHRERMMKDLETDWPKYRHLLTLPRSVDVAAVEAIRSEVHSRDQAFGLVVGYPGFQGWEGRVEGSVTTLTYAYADHPESSAR